MRTLTLIRDQLRYAWALTAVRRGTLGTAAIAVGSFSPAFLPPAPRSLGTSGFDWLTSPVWRVAATCLVLAGVGLLFHAWVSLRPGAHAAKTPPATWFLWSLPLSIAPPLFSRDAYSYAAQGNLLRYGVDPYALGPASVPGGYAEQVDPLWLFTPAPYGPLALQAQRLVVEATGNDAYRAAIGMRVWGLIAVGIMAFALPRLAERVGASPDFALWFGVLNPMVILHFVGGSHNDAVMVALVIVALLLATYDQFWLATATVAAAAGFKQTAVLALIGVVGLVLRERSSTPVTLRRYVAWLIGSSVVVSVVFAAITFVSGLGWGWIPNLAVPASVRSLLAPFTLVGSFFEGILRVFQAPQDWWSVPTKVMQTVGLISAVFAILYVIWRWGIRRPVLAVALAFLVLCFFSPVVQPWYAIWGGALIGAAPVSARVREVAVWATVFLVAYSATDAAVANGQVALGVAAWAWVMWRYRGVASEVSHDYSTYPSVPLDPAGMRGSRVVFERPLFPNR